MRTHRYFWALAAGLLASCADYSVPDSVVNGAVVATNQSLSFDRAKFDSYYLDPVADLIDSDPQNPTPYNLPSSVVQAIDDNMTAAGFAKIPWPVGGLPNPPAATPKTVGIHVTILKGTVNVYYPGYWCDYWYYYSCYYNWSYAGSYNTGTMIMEMGDLSAGGTQLPVAWLAAVYGVASTPTYNTQLAVQGVNRAFGQSPYLYP